MNLFKKKLNVFEVGASVGPHRVVRNPIFNLNYYGFEPEEGSRNELTDLYLSGDFEHMNCHLEPYVVSDFNGFEEFNIYKDREEGTFFYSSIYELSDSEVKRSRGREIVLTNKESYPCKKIDDYVANGVCPNLIIVDAQGASLKIMKGASNAISTRSYGLVLESEFLKLYKNQNLFGDLFNYLYEKDFRLLRFEKCGSGSNGVSTDAWAFSHTVNDALLAWADCYFIKNPKTVARDIKDEAYLGREDVLLYCMTCYLMGCFSLALELIYDVAELLNLNDVFASDDGDWSELRTLISEHLSKCKSADWESDLLRKKSFNPYINKLKKLLV